MYEHSGIAISTTPFNCSWDSGKIGFVLITKKDLREAMNCKRITSKVIEYAKKVIEAEVSEYGQYLNGDVYGYQILDEDGNEIDSCYGYYDKEVCIEGAKSMVV
jgi:hypothetical protein